MTGIRQILAENIKKARKAKGWTQTDLSAASGVSLRGIADIETRRRAPRPDTLKALSGALGVTEEQLYSGSIVTTFASGADSRSDVIARLIETLPSLDERKLRALLNLALSRDSSSGTKNSAG